MNLDYQRKKISNEILQRLILGSYNYEKFQRLRDLTKIRKFIPLTSQKIALAQTKFLSIPIP